jgi:hypothetical protein
MFPGRSAFAGKAEENKTPFGPSGHFPQRGKIIDP